MAIDKGGKELSPAYQYAIIMDGRLIDGKKNEVLTNQILI